jgi:polyisoprenoid-binding protein YceI
MEWTFEPGHTAAEFCARHMMVTYIRGHFKNVHGTLRFDPEKPERSAVSAVIDAKKLWTGDPQRDEHLCSPDFLDVEKYPTITFSGDQVELLGGYDYRLVGDLTIRGVTRKTPLKVSYLGQWETPWWEDGVDKGPKIRAGFIAKTEINRHDFEVNWNSPLTRNGIVVGKIVLITIDAEAILTENS